MAKKKVAKKKPAKKKVSKKKGSRIKQTTFLDLTIKEIDDAAQLVFDAQSEIADWKGELELRQKALHEAREAHASEIGRGRYVTEVSGPNKKIHKFEVVCKKAQEAKTVLKKVPKEKE